MDFLDLTGMPKICLPLPIPYFILDNVVDHEIFSFIDGFSGYNQIKMTLEDKKRPHFTHQ